MWLDTGFEGYLMYPASEAATLPITPTGLRAAVAFADGSTTEVDIAMLEITRLATIMTVPVMLSNTPAPERLPDTGEVMGLIGLGLLRDSRVAVNFRSGGLVTIDTRP